jgi:hypothetical protein
MAVDPETVTPVPELDAITAQALAEMGAELGEEPAAEPEPTPEPDVATEPGEEPEATEEPTEEPDEAAAEPEETEPEKPAEPEIDAEVLAKIERREKASRDRLAQEREQIIAEAKAEAEKMRAEMQQQYPEELVAAAKELRALGLGKGATWEQIAKQAYARHKAEAGDPRYADLAAQQRREAESAQKMTATEQRIADLEAKYEAEVAARRGREMLESATSKVDDAAMPIVARMLERAPSKARDAIAQEWIRLREEYGEEPEPKDVLLSLEKRRRAELDELGIEYDAKPKGKPAAASKAQPTAAKAPAAISSDLGTSTQTRSDPADLDELEAVALRELREGKAGDLD